MDIKCPSSHFQLRINRRKPTCSHKHSHGCLASSWPPSSCSSQQPQQGAPGAFYFLHGNAFPPLLSLSLSEYQVMVADSLTEMSSEANSWLVLSGRSLFISSEGLSLLVPTMLGRLGSWGGPEMDRGRWWVVWETRKDPGSPITDSNR